MAAKSAFTSSRRWLCCLWISLSLSQFRSLSFSLNLSCSCHPLCCPVLLAIINSQQSVVCCASAAFKCSNHKMSLEQLYSYFMSLQLSLLSSFLKTPSTSCFVDGFCLSVCLFVFGAQKKFPNMRLKLNVKMCKIFLCVCVCVSLY